MRLARRRTRTAVADFAEIVASLAHAVGELFLLRDTFRKSAGRSYKTQWTHVPTGASGSSMMSAKLCVFASHTCAYQKLDSH
jgi:hypothetical protein